MNKEERLRELAREWRTRQWNYKHQDSDEPSEWICADELEAALADPTPCATEERLPGERK